jgi:hypothetical protein
MKRSIAIATLAAACGGESGSTADTATTPSTPPPPAAPTAAVRIVSPAEGDTTGADVTVVLGKEGVTIERAAGTRVEGVGHYHLFLDTPAVDEGVVIPPNSTKTVHIGTGDSTFTFRGLSAGPHEIIAVIGYGDHAAMPSRRDTVRFVVKR